MFADLGVFSKFGIRLLTPGIAGTAEFSPRSFSRPCGTVSPLRNQPRTNVLGYFHAVPSGLPGLDFLCLKCALVADFVDRYTPDRVSFAHAIACPAVDLIKPLRANVAVHDPQNRIAKAELE